MKKYRIILAVMAAAMILTAAMGALADPQYPSDSSMCPVTHDNHQYIILYWSDPTCTDQGEALWECNDCGKEYKVTSPALGHIWSNWNITKTPTCTETGSQQRVCRRDKSHVETQSIPALGHDWGSWQVITQPTCTETGTQQRTCKRCGAKETQSIAALGHDWGPYQVDVPATCTESGWDNKTCKRDSSHLWYQKSDPLGHDWGEWVRVKEPSPEGPGLEERTCNRCGIKEEREIPYVGNPVEANPSLLLEVTQTGTIKTIYAPDDVLTFTMTLTNTGNMVLEHPSIIIYRDSSLSMTIDALKDMDVTLAPTESVSFPFSYTLKATDAPVMEIYWTSYAWILGTYSATASTGDGYVPGNSVNLYFRMEETTGAQLTLTFLGGSAAGLKEGDFAAYDVEVKNTGDVPISFSGYVVKAYPDDGFPAPEDYSGWAPFIGTILQPDESFVVTHGTRISSNDAANSVINRTAYAVGFYNSEDGSIQNVNSNDIYPSIPLDEPPEETEPTLVLYVTLADPMDPFITDLNGDTPPVTYDVTLINIWDKDLEFNRITAHGEIRTPALGTLLGGIPASTQIDSFVFNESEIIPGSASEKIKGLVEITFVAYAIDPDTGIEYASNPVTLQHRIKDEGFTDWEPPTETKVSLFKKVISDSILPEGYMLDETVHYEIQVTNESKITLDITVFDPLYGTDPLAVLYGMAPGETRSVFFDYIVCQPDVDNKQIENQANAQWPEPDTKVMQIAYSNKVVVLTAVPEDIYGIKTIVTTPLNGEYYTIGETIRCRITLYNPTALTYKDVELWDWMFAAPWDTEPTAKWSHLDPYGSVYVDFDCLITEDNVGYDFWNDATFNATGNLDHYVTGITNTVFAKTGKEPPHQHYDGGFGPPVGDGNMSCVRTLIGKGEGVFRCTLEYCSDHYQIEQQVRSMLDAAQTEQDKVQAWKNAQALWRDALEKEYQILLQAGTDGAPAAVNATKLNDDLYLESYRALLQQMMPDDPEAVEKAMAEQLMNRVTDLCYMLHNAPKAPKDSVLNGGYTAIAGNRDVVCGIHVLEVNGNKVTYEADLCGGHAGIDTTITAMLNAAENAGAKSTVLVKAQRAWQTAVDGKINEMYKAASAEERSVISANRILLGRMMESKANMLELLYPNNPLIVNEILANMMRDALLSLCGF